MGTHPIFESDFDCLTENVAPFYSERFLKYRGNRDMVIECTSASFDGLIGMMNPDQSWVAKWQRIEKFTPGMYAISVNGRLPNSIVREIKASGVHPRSRDTSQKMRD